MLTSCKAWFNIDTRTKGYHMKKIILATALLTAFPALAGDRVLNTRDIYVDQIIEEPVTRRHCRTVDVPMYDTYERKGSASEAITGGVIGGAIGNQFGGGTGNAVMTLLGVIVGANAADKEERYISGYRQETTCSYDREIDKKRIKVYSHTLVEIEREDGSRYIAEYIK